MSPYEEVVPSESTPLRLDRFLAASGRWGSRARVHRLIEAGCVFVNDKPARPSTRVRPGDRIRVLEERLAEETSEKVRPSDIPLDVLFEDEDLLVVDKPPGLVVHPAPGHWQDTLVSALLHRWKEPAPGLDALRPGIVHRLDKDTSGVLVVCKNLRTLEALARQFRERAVRKEYLAVVWGVPARASGTIDRPIGRHPVERKRMAVRSEGRPARTRFERVASYGKVSLLRLYPETGRTHQIRVHLASAGHPVVGDRVYGRSRAEATRQLGVTRQLLHASALGFRHPRTGEEVFFEAPLPEDMRSVLERCAETAESKSGRGVS
ncbi:MAG: pseudouridine synthase [Candidatus Binatia bacterium]|nr:MAG: pseudouridine synthase [Candidatus Binatia bacterium]